MKCSERDISQCNIALRSRKKHVAVQNLSTYDAWKYIRKQSKNNKLKIKAPTWNDEFELPDGSYSLSYIQDYIEWIKIKKARNINNNSSYSCLHQQS